MNHSAQHSQESGPNQSGPGSEGTPCEPAERFPPCGHTCPRNHHRADHKYEKRADRKPKKPRHSSSNLRHRMRSGSAALATRLRRPTSANQLIRSLSSPRESCDPLADAFQFEMGTRFHGPTRLIVFFLQSDSALLNAESSLAPIEMMFGLSPLTFKPTTLQSSSLNKTDI